MGKTIEQLKAEQAAEIAELEQENRIMKDLEGVPGVESDAVSVCLHRHKSGDFATVKLWADFQTPRKLADAVAIVEHFAKRIVEAEHWKDACCSCWPPEINENAKRESAVLDGSHAVEIDVSGGRGFGPNVNVQFWTRLGGMLCEVAMPVSDLWALVPCIHGNYNRSGDFRGKVDWKPEETQTVDKFRRWWSEPPAYKGSYYLADVYNFFAWASHHGSKQAV